MGKLITFISILIFIDILFMITAQTGFESPGSLIFNAILDPSGLKDSTWWITLITGVSILGIGASIIAGLVTRSSDLLLFIPIGIGLSTLAFDYINIFSYLLALNNILATLILVPLIIIFGITIVEWIRSRD